LTQPEPHRLDGWEHTLEVLNHLESLLDVLADDSKDTTASGLILASAVLWLGRYRDQFKRHLSEPFPNDRSLTGLLKFAALYHDTGKAHTGQLGADGRLHFLGHEDVSVHLLTKRAQALAFSNQEIERANLIVKGHMRVHYLADSAGEIAPRTIYRYFKALGDAGIDVCLLSLADLWATYSTALPQERWLAELQTCRKLLEARWEKPEAVVRPVRLVSGHDLIKELNLQPGKIVGELLELIREAQAAGEVNNRDEALTAAANWLKSNSGGIG
jgi:tRNA nucleotidyltransferase/poly(A) polymerase